MAVVSKEFVEFIKKHQVVGLATAVILGGKVNDLVNSLVNDLFMPLLFQPALKAAQIEDIRALSFHGIKYGKVLGAGVDFVVVAIIIFYFSKVLAKAFAEKGEQK